MSPPAPLRASATAEIAAFN